jgi:hypothetical protein
MGKDANQPGAVELLSTPMTSKTIERLLEEFLADQEARLSPKTFAKYEDLIDLLRMQLESDWPDHDEEESDALIKASGTYCGAVGAEHIAQGFSAFLRHYMAPTGILLTPPSHVVGAVVKALAHWLAEKGYILDGVSAKDLVVQALREVRVSQRLFDRLDVWLDKHDPDDYEETLEGHFRIKRAWPGQLWLVLIVPGAPVIGPIPVPKKISRACQVGWNLDAKVAQTDWGWQLIDVWNIWP